MIAAIRVRGRQRLGKTSTRLLPARSFGPRPSSPQRGQRRECRSNCSKHTHLLRRRRRSVDLWLARRRGRQHPALRARFPRRQGDPDGAQLPLDRTSSRRRFASDRTQRRPARQDAAHRRCRRRKGDGDRRVDSEEEARAIGEEIEQLQADGHALNDIAILVRASFQMREFEDRFVTLGLPYRVIGGPRFTSAAEIPRCARLSASDQFGLQRSRLRAHGRCAQAPGLATPPCSFCTIMRAKGACR